MQDQKSSAMCYNIVMPYYAVGFGHWSCSGPGFHMDGSRAKTAGPFKTAAQAWKAANTLQRGASMMCDFPFVFKSEPNMTLSQLTNKIDSGEYEFMQEYKGKRAIHVLRFKRDYEGEFAEVGWRHNCPSSMPARRRYQRMIRQNSALKNPFKQEKLLRTKRAEQEIARFQDKMRRSRYYTTGKPKFQIVDSVEAPLSCQ